MITHNGNILVKSWLPEQHPGKNIYSIHRLAFANSEHGKCGSRFFYTQLDGHVIGKGCVIGHYQVTKYGNKH